MAKKPHYIIGFDGREYSTSSNSLTTKTRNLLRKAAEGIIESHYPYMLPNVIPIVWSDLSGISYVYPHNCSFITVEIQQDEDLYTRSMPAVPLAGPPTLPVYYEPTIEEEGESDTDEAAIQQTES